MNPIYFSSYFIINILLVLTYPFLRIFTQAGQRDLRHKDQFGFTYQNSILYTVIALLTIQYLRSSSIPNFISDSFTILKIGIVCLLFFAEYNYSLIYFAISVILWITVPYPKYRASNKFIHIQSEDQFQKILNKNPKLNGTKIDSDYGYQYKHKNMYFIQFYANWVLNCQFAKQIWYEYSNKYTTDKLKFLSVNVDKNPQLAKKYKINATGFSKQLPTVIMLEQDEQVCRFPPIDKNGKIGKVQKLDYKILLRYFDLQSRFLQTRF